MVLAGRLGGASWRGSGHEADVLVAKGVLGAALDRLGVEWRVESLTAPHLTPGRAARVLVGDRVVGELGELHPAWPRASSSRGRSPSPRWISTRIVAAVPERVVQRPVSAFPPVLQDVAVVVARDVPAAALVSTAREAGAPLLREVDVFDVFRDARFGDDAVSIGLRLAFGADDRTLTEAEASEVRGAIVAALAERHGARLRG